MQFFRKSFLFAFLFVLVTPKIYSSHEIQLRIGLLKMGFPSLFYIIPSDQRIEVFNQAKNQSLYTGPAKILFVKADPKGMMIFLEDKFLTLTKEPCIFSAVGKFPRYLWIGTQPQFHRAYRGSLLIFQSGLKLGAINIVYLEDYLKSVVPSEMGWNAPFSAFTAQAIAARTYALRNLRRHFSSGFNLCDEVHCQAYFGLQKENPTTSQAVEVTRNIVLTYDGKFANTVYHSTCGGRVSSSQEVWGGKPVPYLIAHDDRIGSDKPFCSWVLENRTSEKKTQAISNPSLVFSNQLLQLSKNPLFKARAEARPTESLSYSRGHKVGMCQNGAIGMARAGYNANQILSFYYPNTVLQNFQSNVPLLLPFMPPKIVTLSERLPPASPSGNQLTKKPKSFLAENAKLTVGKHSRDFRKWYWCNIPIKHGTKVQNGAFTKPAKPRGKNAKISLPKNKKKGSKNDKRALS